MRYKNCHRLEKEALARQIDYDCKILRFPWRWYFHFWIHRLQHNWNIIIKLQGKWASWLIGFRKSWTNRRKTPVIKNFPLMCTAFNLCVAVCNSPMIDQRSLLNMALYWLKLTVLFGKAFKLSSFSAGFNHSDSLYTFRDISTKYNDRISKRYRC